MSMSAWTTPYAPKVLAKSKKLVSPAQLPQAIPQTMGLLQEHFKSQALYTVVQLGVPDVIGDGLMDSAGISAALGVPVNEDLLARQMRVLATCGLFEESAGPGGEFMYALTDTGALLQTGAPQPSLACAATHWLEPPMWNMWGSLLEATMTPEGGQPPFDRANGANWIEYFQAHPESMAPFNDTMSFFSGGEVAGVVDDYAAGWDQFKGKTVLDVGGSYGVVMAAVKAKNPDIECISFDLPDVIATAPDGIAPGVSLAGGDMFDASTYPKGVDAVFMKHILHDWSDADCGRILAAIAASLPSGGKVIVCDGVLGAPGDINPLTASQRNVDILMAGIGGTERTEAQWRTLLGNAGFSIESVQPASIGGPLCGFVTAVKA